MGVRKSDKIILTGDDLLVEYCERLIQSLKQNQESFLKQLWKVALDTFINHPAWPQNL